MEYNLDSVTSIEACDAHLVKANEAKAALQLRELNKNAQFTNSERTLAARQVELQELNAALTSVVNEIAGLPEGTAKRKATSKKMHLDREIYDLNTLMESNTDNDSVDRQFDLSEVQYKIQCVDEFITLMQERRTQLAA